MSKRVDFDKVKADADFRTVLNYYGISVEGTREQVKIRCPFHEDKRPSCSINLPRKVFHCFGCGAKGNILDFVHRIEAERGNPCSIREAALRLAEISGGVPASHAKKRREGRNEPLRFQLKLERDHPYVRERVESDEVAESFGIGVAERGLMKGRLCIPVHDEEGMLVAYMGRYCGDPPDGEPKYLFPQGFQKHLVLWNLHRVRHVRHLVVVEGAFDVMRLFTLRLPAVALLGTSISPEQVELLRGCPHLTHISVMLDGDEAGRAAAPAVVSALAPHFWVREVRLPDGQQPDTADTDTLKALLGKKG